MSSDKAEAVPSNDCADSENNRSKKAYKIEGEFIVPQENLGNFQSIFSFIKKKIQIKYSRKAHIDSLLKKSKGKFFKAVHRALNICLKQRVKRLPQKFITNVTIQYNKRFMHESLIFLYNTFNLLPPFSEIVSKKMLFEDKRLLFDALIHKNINQIYKEYLESKQFIKDLKEVQEIDGKRSGILYKFVADNLIRYYEFSKPRVGKGKESARKINASAGENDGKSGCFIDQEAYFSSEVTNREINNKFSAGNNTVVNNYNNNNNNNK